MSIAVTLLISSGAPDPNGTLSSDQEQVLLGMLTASPVPSVPVVRRRGDRVTLASWRETAAASDGVVYLGWIRGGTVVRTADKPVLENWLLGTGQPTIAPHLFSELKSQIAPHA